MKNLSTSIPVSGVRAHNQSRAGRLPLRRRGNSPGFSLVEIMVVVALFSLIILALLTVFNTTQGAFRSSVTQTDVQQNGRAAMDLMTSDLRAMYPSGGTNFGVPNLSADLSQYFLPAYNQPLIQSMIPADTLRTNVLENVFILNRVDQTWTGVGYVVDFLSPNYVNPLYRYSRSIDAREGTPYTLYTNFLQMVNYNFAFEASNPGVPNTNWNSMSRLLQGVVHLEIHAYGTNGQWLSSLSSPNMNTNNGVYFPSFNWSAGEFYMYSNTLPSAIELQLGVLEDRTVQHAEGLVNLNVRSNYLSGQAGKVHLFRQSLNIPNFDPAVYQ